MVYSTCTFNPAENEENAEWFLTNHPGWEKESFCLPEVDGESGMFTCFPHKSRGEGQFAALFRKQGHALSNLPENRSLPVPGKEIVKMLKSMFPALPEGTHMIGDTVIHMFHCPELKGIRTFRIGLHLGKYRGNRIIPDHASAYFASAGTQHTELSPETALRYMAGETVKGGETGWTVVCLNEVPLGWGKGSEGTVKNHLPKGLRNGRLVIDA